MKFVVESVGIVRKARARFRSETIENGSRTLYRWTQSSKQCFAVWMTIKKSNIVKRCSVSGQDVGLCVIHHLHAMFDCSQQSVGVRKLLRIIVFKTARCR